MISSREVLKKLKADGWEVVMVKGSHHHLKHPTKQGKVTVKHPAKDFPIGTIRSMEAQSGVELI
ncbi:MAG: hypothetical protein JWM95_2323 [Gemmatimonadetes bacterium]|nr:hypothetical protein [Gemmatimonadota bacterium]